MTTKTTTPDTAPDATHVHATLGDALAAFQSEMPTVFKGKTAKVPTKAGSSYSYSFADIADVTRAVMPLLSAHGLAFTCTPRSNGGSYELAGRLIHGASGESVEGALPLFGHTSQEIGSALTYSRRYLLGCLTGVVTDDDEDGQAATNAAKNSVPGAARTKAAQRSTMTDDQVVDAASKADSIDALRTLWDEQNVGRRDQDIQDYVNNRVLQIREGAAGRMNAAMGS